MTANFICTSIYLPKGNVDPFNGRNKNFPKKFQYYISCPLGIVQ